MNDLMKSDLKMSSLNVRTTYHISGADPGFQVRGTHLIKLRRAEGGAKILV